MFRATMCPSSGADVCVVLSPRVGIVPWLQEGCQNRLAGSVSIEEFVVLGSDSLPAATAQHQYVALTLRSRQLLKMGTWLSETCWATCKREIKDNTKVTSSCFLIHTELRCTVNHTSGLCEYCSVDIQPVLILRHTVNFENLHNHRTTNHCSSLQQALRDTQHQSPPCMLYTRITQDNTSYP